ncbi:hypothetical protein FA13DRAFT_1725449 [Coprinellus micaceus]|uniref:Uncharacterized protein n=1 Tax=Coprinellus micaceus TaxID=71717 RepID=A0A4Y7TUF2_COPMI|nr:hypothetical protein FA13DRAFT_1725449 [Coprinellus micaceus]
MEPAAPARRGPTLGQYRELQQRLRECELENARLREALQAAQEEAKEANENSVNFWGKNMKLEAHLKESHDLGKTANDHALKVLNQNQKKDAEIERQNAEIQRQGVEIQRQGVELAQKDGEIQRQGAEIFQKDTEIERLRAENEWLRAQQVTEEVKNLFHRFVAICRWFWAQILVSQGIDGSGNVLEVKVQDDAAHLAELLEHAIRDGVALGLFNNQQRPGLD